LFGDPNISAHAAVNRAPKIGKDPAKVSLESTQAKRLSGWSPRRVAAQVPGWLESIELICLATKQYYWEFPGGIVFDQYREYAFVHLDSYQRGGSSLKGEICLTPRRPLSGAAGNAGELGHGEGLRHDSTVASNDTAKGRQ